MKPGTVLWFLLCYLALAPLACALHEETPLMFALGGMFVKNKRSFEALFDFNGHGTAKLPHCKRRGKLVPRAELGPVHQRRAHQMDAKSLWKLFEILKPHMDNAGSIAPKKGSTKKHQNGAPNGVIAKSARLGMALRILLVGIHGTFLEFVVLDTQMYTRVCGWLLMQSTTVQH